MAKIFLGEFGNKIAGAQQPSTFIDARPINEALYSVGKDMMEREDASLKLSVNNELLMRQQAKAEIDAQLANDLQNNRISSEEYVKTRQEQVKLYDDSRAEARAQIPQSYMENYFIPNSKKDDISDIPTVASTYLTKQHDEQVGNLETSLTLIDKQYTQDGNLDKMAQSLNALTPAYQTLFGTAASAKQAEHIDKMYVNHVDRISLGIEEALIAGDYNTAIGMYDKAHEWTRYKDNIGSDAWIAGENKMHNMLGQIRSSIKSLSSGDGSKLADSLKQWEAAMGNGDYANATMHLMSANKYVLQSKHYGGEIDTGLEANLKIANDSTYITSQIAEKQKLNAAVANTDITSLMNDEQKKYYSTRQADYAALNKNVSGFISQQQELAQSYPLSILKSPVLQGTEMNTDNFLDLARDRLAVLRNAGRTDIGKSLFQSKEELQQFQQQLSVQPPSIQAQILSEFHQLGDYGKESLSLLFTNKDGKVDIHGSILQASVSKSPQVTVNLMNGHKLLQDGAKPLSFRVKDGKYPAMESAESNALVNKYFGAAFSQSPNQELARKAFKEGMDAIIVNAQSKGLSEEALTKSLDEYAINTVGKKVENKNVFVPKEADVNKFMGALYKKYQSNAVKYGIDPLTSREFSSLATISNGDDENTYIISLDAESGNPYEYGSFNLTAKEINDFGLEQRPVASSTLNRRATNNE